MNLHQIVSGACNAGDKCFAVGSVEGVPFTVIGKIKRNLYHLTELFCTLIGLRSWLQHSHPCINIRTSTNHPWSRSRLHSNQFD